MTFEKYSEKSRTSRTEAYTNKNIVRIRLESSSVKDVFEAWVTSILRIK